MTPDNGEPFFNNLNRLYENAHLVQFGSTSGFVILNDLHLGDGSKRDDFLKNSGLCFFILKEYYRKNKYTLILNGDVEELHRFPFKKIRGRWAELYDIFDEFDSSEGLFKLLGNHDYMNRHLAPADQKYRHYESLRFNYDGNSIFIFHGHQANMFYEKHNDFAGKVLRYLANPLMIKNSSVAHDSKKRFLIERRVYEFSSRMKILSIIGHTHRPLFESLSKVDSLKLKIELLCREYPQADKRERLAIEEQIQSFKEALINIYHGRERRRRRSTLYNLHFVVPCLFNSGCVIGKRGITALELTNDEIRLVHWLDSEKHTRYQRPTDEAPEVFGRYIRTVINRDKLENLFTRIRLLT